MKLTENKLLCHDKVCKDKDFSGTTLQVQKDNILEFNISQTSIYEVR